MGWQSIKRYVPVHSVTQSYTWQRNQKNKTNHNAMGNQQKQNIYLVNTWSLPHSMIRLGTQAKKKMHYSAMGRQSKKSYVPVHFITQPYAPGDATKNTNTLKCHRKSTKTKHHVPGQHLATPSLNHTPEETSNNKKNTTMPWANNLIKGTYLTIPSLNHTTGDTSKRTNALQCHEKSTSKQIPPVKIIQSSQRKSGKQIKAHTRWTNSHRAQQPGYQTHTCQSAVLRPQNIRGWMVGR